MNTWVQDGLLKLNDSKHFEQVESKCREIPSRPRKLECIERGKINIKIAEPHGK